MGFLGEIFNHPDVKMGETVSAGCQGTAKGLARFAAIMANGGSLFGHQLLKKETWDLIHSEPDYKIQARMGDYTCYTKGGIHYFMPLSDVIKDFDMNHPYIVPKYSALSTKLMFKNREGWYGWFGFGGATMQWHPELGLGFAYVPTDLMFLDLNNKKAAGLQKIVADI